MPIFTAAVAAFSAVSTFIGGLGTLGTFVLKTAVGVGLNLLAQAVAGKPQKPKFSINGTLQRGGDLSRSFIIGKTATAGSLVYANTWSRPNKTPNEYLTQVIALSDYPVNGLAELWVNGEKVTIGDEDSAGMGRRIVQYQTDGGSDNHMWVKFYDGTQSSADTFLTGTVSSSSRPYESSRIGSGVAYAIVTAQVAENLFTGIPSFKFVLNGAKLYDISRDSTAGGSGSHDWGNPATWGGDGDHLPAVQIYNIIRGLTWNGKWFYGLQNMSGTRLPATNWIQQINKCRATIAGASGPEPTYRSGGEIDIEAPISDAVETCLTACQGRISETGGVYKIHVGAPDNPVAFITDGDILSTEEQSFTPFFGLSDTINGITATYPSPEENWAPKVAPPLLSSTFEAEDGNRRLMADVPLDFVPYAEQVQRLMRSALEEARRARRHTFVLPAEYWVLEPGDMISFTSERNGYENKLFRVDGVADKANLDVMIDITEVDPADYDWDSEADFHPPVDGAVGPLRPAPQPIVDWFAEPDSVDDNDGNARRPAILLSWDGDQVDVIGVEFEVRNGVTLQVQYRNRTDNPSVGSIQISQGLLPNTLYGVRGRYIAGSDRETLWSTWLLVTTPNVLLGADDLYLPGMVDEVLASLNAKLDWIGESIRVASDERQRIDSLLAEAGAQSFDDRKEITATVGNFSASFSEQLTVVATATESAVLQIVQLTAQMNDPVNGLAAIADITHTNSASITTIDGNLTAVTNTVNANQVTIGRFSANGLFRSEQVATQSGALSTIGLSVSATGGGATSQSALFLSAIAGGLSELGITADTFYVVNGAAKRRPFVITGGVLYADELRVTTLAALSATLGNVDISNAIIGNLIVGTSNLGFRAVTANTSYSFPNTSGDTGFAWVTMATSTSQNPEQTPVFCEYGLFLTASAGVTPALAGVRWRHVQSGAILKQVNVNVTNGAQTSNDVGFFLHDTPALGTNTYVLERQSNSIAAGGTASAYVKSVWWKK